MRKVVILALASLFAFIAACEIALPFDRSLIPEEGGVSDSSLPDGEDVTTAEDSSPTEDTFVPPPDAEDGPVGRDGSAAEGSAPDGSTDGMPPADASDSGDASDAGALD